MASMLLASFMASATMLYSGGIDSSSGGGLTATSSWGDGNSSLEYTVEELPNGFFSYLYSWEATKKDLSHLIIEVSQTFTEENIFPGTTSGWELGLWSSAQGASNVGIPGPLYGLKFPGTTGLTGDFKIITDRGPKPGSFYAKDGKDPKGGLLDVYAFNTSFGGANTDLSNGVPSGMIVVPDTKANPPTVPEIEVSGGGASMVLLVFGGLLLLEKKRAQKIR